MGRRIESRDDLTYDYINECVIYNEDGSLTWKLRPEHHFASKRYMNLLNGRFANKPAFNNINNMHNYYQGSINSVIMLRHTVVWVLHHHRFPIRSIKHFDGDRQNDKIENLYETGNKKVFGTY